MPAHDDLLTSMNFSYLLNFTTVFEVKVELTEYKREKSKFKNYELVKTMIKRLERPHERLIITIKDKRLSVTFLDKVIKYLKLYQKNKEFQKIKELRLTSSYKYLE